MYLTSKDGATLMLSKSTHTYLAWTIVYMNALSINHISYIQYNCKYLLYHLWNTKKEKEKKKKLKSCISCYQNTQVMYIQLLKPLTRMHLLLVELRGEIIECI